MKNEQVDIIVKEDGIYEVRIVFPKERFNELIRDSYGYRDNLASKVTEIFAAKYVTDHYQELMKLIDLDLVKLLATRNLTRVLAKGVE